MWVPYALLETDSGPSRGGLSCRADVRARAAALVRRRQWSVRRHRGAAGRHPHHRTADRRLARPRRRRAVPAVLLPVSLLPAGSLARLLLRLRLSVRLLRVRLWLSLLLPVRLRIRISRL